MKKIIITENQYKRIFYKAKINEDDVPKIGGSDVPTNTSSEIGTTPRKITDSNGEETLPKPTKSTKIGKTVGNSNVFGTTVGGYRLQSTR
jgi:DNA-directed RNA polymerase subunit H (RpoH/RPB5)